MPIPFNMRPTSSACLLTVQYGPKFSAFLPVNQGVRAMRKYPAIAILPLLVACATTDPSSLPRLEAEVNAYVKNGMLKTEATSALTSHGFSCSIEGTSTNPNMKGIVECTRNRGPIWPPYSCIQRVLFDINASTSVISNLDVWRPSCASM